MAAAICRQIGARKIVITDVNDFRLQLARECGADLAINVATADPVGEIKAAMRDLKITIGFDVGLEMSGKSMAFDNMLETMLHGGEIALLGLPSAQGFNIDLEKIVMKGRLSRLISTQPSHTLSL
eukprot:m.85150 g.85150  ORF g.85150 m.85150 type:complete len:125 (+) comp12184_c0_seq3:218-592(+)